MTNREYLKNEIDRLPEFILERIQAFISFQKFSIGLLESDTDYLNSIPGMAQSIQEAIDTPIEECISLRELWPDV